MPHRAAHSICLRHNALTVCRSAMTQDRWNGAKDVVRTDRTPRLNRAVLQYGIRRSSVPEPDGRVMARADEGRAGRRRAPRLQERAAGPTAGRREQRSAGGRESAARARSSASTKRPAHHRRARSVLRITRVSGRRRPSMAFPASRSGLPRTRPASTRSTGDDRRAHRDAHRRTSRPAPAASCPEQGRSAQPAAH